MIITFLKGEEKVDNAPLINIRYSTDQTSTKRSINLQRNCSKILAMKKIQKIIIHDDLNGNCLSNGQEGNRS